MDDPHLSRRATLRGAVSVAFVTMLPTVALASDGEVAAAIQATFGDAPRRRGRIKLTLPPLAESGNSVPLTVAVESPMTAEDFVRRVCVFADRNPRPLVATVMFGTGAGRAEFNTNMRLSGTQDVVAVAEMSDGTLWTERASVAVTIGACDSLQMRY